jgi:predicted nuclease with TOPRIM domain
MAIQAEVDARKALEEAIQRVSTSKARLGHVTKARSLTEEAFYRIKGDIQKMDPVLERKQERVRVELLRKQESSQHPKDIGPMDAATVGTFTPVSIWDPALLQLHPKDQGGDVVLEKIMNDSQRIQFHQNQIQDLRRRQEELEGEIESMQLKISRMNSRAQKLMERCQEYDNL